MENPPSPHALWRHADGGLDVCCGLVIKDDTQCFCFTHALFHFNCIKESARRHSCRRTSDRDRLLANVWFHILHWDHYRVSKLNADLYPLSVSLYPTAGDGSDPASVVPHSLLHPPSLWVVVWCQALSSAALSPMLISIALPWPPWGLVWIYQNALWREHWAGTSHKTSWWYTVTRDATKRTKKSSIVLIWKKTALDFYIYISYSDEKITLDWIL